MKRCEEGALYNPQYFCRDQLGNAVFCFFLAYLVFGNLFRIIKLPFFGDGILITEGILYFLTLAYFFSRPTVTREIFYGLCCGMVLTLSTCYGICMHGWDLRSVLYALRTVAMVMSAIILGRILFERYQENMEGLLKKLVNIYALAAAAGVLILVCFPRTEVLWILLAKFGIFFQGDPHTQRYISVYFDPNFYAAIAGMPLLFSWSLYEKSGSKRHLTLVILFSLTILLTWSRSGIAANILLLACMWFFRLRSTRFRAVNIRRAVIGVIALIGFIIVANVYIDSFRGFIDRFVTMSSDYSALQRLNSALYGISLLDKFLFFGVGYNYLTFFMQEYSVLSMLDSSLLSLLVNFGLIFFLLVLGAYILWLLQVYSFAKALQIIDPWKGTLLLDFFAYLNISIFFASHFNNLIFFQFWLIPVLMTCTYFLLYKGKYGLGFIGGASGGR